MFIIEAVRARGGDGDRGHAITLHGGEQGGIEVGVVGLDHGRLADGQARAVRPVITIVQLQGRLDIRRDLVAAIEEAGALLQREGQKTDLRRRGRLVGRAAIAGGVGGGGGGGDVRGQAGGRVVVAIAQLVIGQKAAGAELDAVQGRRGAGVRRRSPPGTSSCRRY